MHPVAYLVMIFGFMLAVTGIVLFIKRGAEGTSSIKIFGFEFSLGGSSLVVFVLGVVLFILPFVRKNDFPLISKNVTPVLESGIERKAHVQIYSHPTVFTSNDALKMKNSLNAGGYSVQVHEHSRSGIPDSIFIDHEKGTDLFSRRKIIPAGPHAFEIAKSYITKFSMA